MLGSAATTVPAPMTYFNVAGSPVDQTDGIVAVPVGTTVTFETDSTGYESPTYKVVGNDLRVKRTQEGETYLELNVDLVDTTPTYVTLGGVTFEA